MLDGFLALSVDEPLLAADLHGEQVALLIRLNERLLVLELAHLRDLD